MECDKVRGRKEPIFDDRAQNVTKCSSHGKTLGEVVLTEWLVGLCHDSGRYICSCPQLAVSFGRKHNRTGRERELMVRDRCGGAWTSTASAVITPSAWERQGRRNWRRTRW